MLFALFKIILKNNPYKIFYSASKRIKKLLTTFLM